MVERYLYFTELVGMRVFDLKHRSVGRVRDAAIVPVVDSSRVDRVLVGGGDAWLTVRYDQIGSITLDEGIALADEQLTPYHEDEFMLRIGRDLLDQQIIDVTGRKVVRVNDLTFEIRNGGERDVLAVLEVDIGVRSIFRRVLQRALPPRVIRRLQEPIPPNSIKWEFCNVLESDPLRRLRLNISYQKLEHMHPADLADIVEELSHAEREAIFESIDSEVAAEALTEVDPKMQASILEALEPEKAADIVEEMDAGRGGRRAGRIGGGNFRGDPRRDGFRAEDRGSGAAGIRRGHGRRHDEYAIRLAARECSHRGRRRGCRGRGGTARNPEHVVPGGRGGEAHRGGAAGPSVRRAARNAA